MSAPSANKFDYAIPSAAWSLPIFLFAYLVYSEAASGYLFIVGMIGALLSLVLTYILFRIQMTGNKGLFVLFGLVSLQYLYFIFPFLNSAPLMDSIFFGTALREDNAMHIIIFSGLFIVLFALGFILAPSLLPDIKIRTGLAETVMNSPTLLILAVMAATLVALNIKLDLAAYDYFPFLSRLLFLFFPFCIVIMYSRDRGFFAWSVVVALMPFYFLISIGNGATASWILGCLIIIAGGALIRKKINWLMLGCLLVSVPILFSAKKAFREEFVYTEGTIQISRLQAGVEYLQMGIASILTALESNSKGDTEQVARVVMGPIVFSRVIDAVDAGSVQLQWGATFMDLPLSFIPRALAPWKPEKTTGQWFGHAFGFLSPLNFTTSVNLPPIVESYWNFGDIGVLVAILLGALCGFMSRMLGDARTTSSAVSIALVFSGFGNSESSISIVYGQAIQMTAVLIMGSMVFGKKA